MVHPFFFKSGERQPGVLGSIFFRPDLVVVVDEGPQPIDEEAGYALCYRVLRRLAMSPYVREVTDLKDYVRAPKPNGYRSLHATLLRPL